MKGVCTDKKIGQNTLTCATSLAIGRMRNPGRVRMVCRKWGNPNADLL